MIHSTIDIHLFAEILLLAWAVWKLIEKNQLFIPPQISEAFIDQNPINPGLYGLTIAQATGANLNTVKARLYRALKK